MPDSDDGRTALIVGLSVGFGTAVFVGILVIIALICRKKLKEKDTEEEKRYLEGNIGAWSFANPHVTQSTDGDIDNISEDLKENSQIDSAESKEEVISFSGSGSSIRDAYGSPGSTLALKGNFNPATRSLSLKFPLGQQWPPSVAGLPTYNHTSKKSDKKHSYPIHRSASVLAQKRATEVLMEFREQMNKQDPYQTVPMTQAQSHKQALIDQLKQNYPKNPIPKLVKTDTRSQEREEQYKSNWVAEQERCNINRSTISSTTNNQEPS